MRTMQIIAASILIIMGSITTYLLWSTNGVYYRSYSPNGEYSVYSSSYAYHMFLPGSPGQSGDRSGEVYLYDEIQREIINSAPIDMLSLVRDIQWTDTTAYLKGDHYPNITNPWVLPRAIEELAE